ncbi:MAG TPA: aminotransferase class I and II, partial [Casimicrobiaceae bacterium]
ARSEPDPQIQDLIRASAGRNLGLDYLPGATTFDPVVDNLDAALASSIVWFDALVSNVDRTARNTNMLIWHRRPWLIDHGAAFYFHHAGEDFTARAREPFARIREHVLLPQASALAEVDGMLAAKLADAIIAPIVAAVPASWLDPHDAAAAEAARSGYRRYLRARLEAPRAFVEEAIRARTEHL